MYCSKCGNVVAEDADFCHICGTKINHGEMEELQKDIVPTKRIKGSSSVTEELTQIGKLEKTSDTDINDFKKFIDNYVQKNTEYQTAEELLRSKVSLRFVWICFAVPAVLIFIVYLINRSVSVMEAIFVMIFASLLFGYLSAYIIGIVKKGKLSLKYRAKFEGNIDADDLIMFLNKYLGCLYPYFHEWGHIKRQALSVRGAVELSVEDSMRKYLEEINLCTEFGENQRRLSIIIIRPDTESQNSGKMEYYPDVENRIEGASFLSHDMGFAKYRCLYKTAPILQAAMEYYLKIFRIKENAVLFTNSRYNGESQVNSVKTQSVTNMYTSSSNEKVIVDSMNKSKKSKGIFLIAGIAVLGLISLIGVYALRNKNYNKTEEIITIEEAERMVNHWLIDHPIEPDYQSILSSSEELQGFDAEGNDSWKFDLWIAGEEYAVIFVNKDDGDIVIEYSVWNEIDRTISSDQMLIERWYSEVYLLETTNAATISEIGYNEICFNGISISELLNSSSTELVQMFGGGYNADGNGRIAYNEIEFYMLNDETVDTIWSFYPEYFMARGYTLDTNLDYVVTKDEIVELLGQYFEEEWFDSGYYLTYDYPLYTISFGINKYSEVSDIVVCNKNSVSTGSNAFGVNDAIENYYGLSGSYSGNMEGSMLSLSIYSSREEGEVSIGNVEIYVGNGDYYFGEIIAVEGNIYTVITETGDEVFLVESMVDGTIVLQLCVDGQCIEEYKMVEHYES